MDNEEDRWREQLKNVIYQDWRPEEEDLKRQIAHSLKDEEEILQEADRFHEAHTRCAFVMTLHFGAGGEIRSVDGFIADEVTVMELLPFDPIKEALGRYDPQEELCLVVVRNSEAVTDSISRDHGNPADNDK